MCSKEWYCLGSWRNLLWFLCLSIMRKFNVKILLNDSHDVPSSACSKRTIIYHFLRNTWKLSQSTWALDHGRGSSALRRWWWLKEPSCWCRSPSGDLFWLPVSSVLMENILLPGRLILGWTLHGLTCSCDFIKELQHFHSYSSIMPLITWSLCQLSCYRALSPHLNAFSDFQWSMQKLTFHHQYWPSFHFNSSLEVVLGRQDNKTPETERACILCKCTIEFILPLLVYFQWNIFLIHVL